SSSEVIQYPAAFRMPLEAPTMSQDRFLSPSEDTILPASISWNMLSSYAGDALVLAMGHQGIVSIDLGQTPHVLLSGSSGTGKTRRALRPLIAQALAQGVVLVLLNESAADFSPFYDHPNAFLIRGSAATYMAFLESAIREMERREPIL